MSTPPKHCPKCTIDWGVEKLERPAPPKDAPSLPPETVTRYRCNACYHRWEVPS